MRNSGRINKVEQDFGIVRQKVTHHFIINAIGVLVVLVVLVVLHPIKRCQKVAGLKEGHEMLEKEANAKIDAVTASTGV